MGTSLSFSDCISYINNYQIAIWYLPSDFDISWKYIYWLLWFKERFVYHGCTSIPIKIIHLFWDMISYISPRLLQVQHFHLAFTQIPVVGWFISIPLYICLEAPFLFVWRKGPKKSNLDKNMLNCTSTI